MLEHDGDIDVLAVCGTAEEAIAALSRVAPELVTMDIELPGMNGLEAVGEIMSSRPLPILVLSSYVGPASDKASAALAAGALDVLAKDDLDVRDPASGQGAQPGPGDPASGRQAHRLAPSGGPGASRIGGRRVLLGGRPANA